MLPAVQWTEEIVCSRSEITSDRTTQETKDGNTRPMQ